VSSQHVSRRRFGDVDTAVIHAGLLHVPPQPDWRMKESGYPLDELRRPITGINGFVVRIDGAVVLVDPNSWLTGGTVESKYASTLLVAGPSIEESLAVMGVACADVTHVLVTHGHWDHYSAVIDADGRPRFPNAQHFFPAADWQAFAVENQRDDAALLHAHLDPLADAGLLQLVSGDHEVTARVTLLETPGESPGHQSVRIDTPDGGLYYLGDLFHYPAEFEQLETVGVGRDPAQMISSRQRVLASMAQDEGGAAALFTHGVFPAWGQVEQRDDGSRQWRYGPGTD
jgi:glyoxylase-like metal-dependent hydrolase (beta-lactamase superfamily II)